MSKTLAVPQNRKVLHKTRSSQMFLPMMKNEDLKLTGQLLHKCNFAYVIEGYKQINPVVIKRFRTDNLTEKEIERLKNELSSFPSLKKPNVIRGLAFTLEPELQLIMDYCQERHFSIKKIIEKKIVPSAYDLYDWIVQVAEGMNALHQKEIVHRYLNSRKILLTVEDGVVKLKITGFGITKKLNEEKFTKESTNINAWRAPELILGTEKYTHESDMYAFGIIFAELLGCRYPNYFHPLSLYAFHRVNQIDEENKLSLPILLTDKLKLTDREPEVVELLSKCCNYNPNERATFKEVIEKLSKIINYQKMMKAQNYPSLNHFFVKEQSVSKEVKPEKIRRYVSMVQNTEEGDKLNTMGSKTTRKSRGRGRGRVKKSLKKDITIGENGRYKTLERGLKRVREGDKVAIEEGTYYTEGNIYINTNNLTISGPKSKVKIICKKPNPIFIITGNSVRIFRIQFINECTTKDRFPIVHIRSPKVELNNIDIETVSNSSNATSIVLDSEQVSLRCKASKISRGLNGIYLQSKEGSITLNGVEFNNQDEHGIFIQNCKSYQIDKCNFHDINGDGIRLSPHYDEIKNCENIKQFEKLKSNLTCTKGWIKNCTFLNNDSAGVRIVSSCPTKMLNNDFKGCNPHIWAIEGTDFELFQSNTYHPSKDIIQGSLAAVKEECQKWQISLWDKEGNRKYFMKLHQALKKTNEETTVELASGDYDLPNLDIIQDDIKIYSLGNNDHPVNIYLHKGPVLFKAGTGLISGVVFFVENEKNSAIEVENGHLTLENCKVWGVKSAPSILINKGAELTLKKCKIREGQCGVTLLRAGSLNVYDSIISNNRKNGLFMKKGSQLVSENTIYSKNGLHGIYLSDQSNASIEGGAISSNAQVGLYADIDSSVTIENADVSDNKSHGIYLRSAQEGIVKNCRVYLNKNFGISCNNKTPQIANNKIFFNKDGGMAVYKLARPTIQNNYIFSNFKTGVQIIQSIPKMENNYIIGNLSHGIEYQGKVKGIISKNVFEKNLFKGIYGKEDPLFKKFGNKYTQNFGGDEQDEEEEIEKIEQQFDEFNIQSGQTNNDDDVDEIKGTEIQF
ncbi:hypothetical protein M0812_01337 [Anaeramoeba flamelloides]|uniref:Protein kinase domain-containing protein n=1 Tax=Anaeramoeba flamelloides TaxID=1746091 RepID=A0AAV8A639_9EUKA|nr:hypothetical protein M0812_01337 [Anaeramoeba flamelloides]